MKREKLSRVAYGGRRTAMGVVRGRGASPPDFNVDQPRNLAKSVTVE